MTDLLPPTVARPARPPGVWIAAVTLVVVATLAAGVRWGWCHPLPTTWDEAHYTASLNGDHYRWKSVGPRRYVAGLLYDDGRPPAYRLLVAPWVVLTHAVDLAPLRAINVAWLAAAAAVSGVVVWRLTRSAAAATATAAATVLIAKTFASTIHFGTEPAVYLGTVLTFAGLLLDWDRPTPRRLGWVVLAAGLALSVLAKATVVVMVGLPPVLVLALYWSGRLRGPSPAYLAKAAVAAAVVAGPWWALNWRRARVLAQGGVAVQRRSFGPVGLRSWGLYLAEMVHYEIGPAVSVLILVPLVAVAWVVVRRRRPPLWPGDALPVPALDLALLTVVAPAVITIAVQLVTTNQDGRLVSHAYVALALAAGLAVGRLGWLRATSVRVAVLVLLTVQAAMLAGPPSTVAAVADRAPVLAVGHNPILRPWDQWDWRPFRAACDARGLAHPSIAMLGQAPCFNVPQVEAVWSPDGVVPKVEWLWRYEQRDFSMDAVAAAAGRADVVLTVPGLVGMRVEHEELDNQYNAAFADRLAADPTFGPPLRLTMGTLTPAVVDVFFRRRPATGPAPR